MAIAFSQLGILKAERGGGAGLVTDRQVKALAIRPRPRCPAAVTNRRRLAAPARAWPGAVHRHAGPGHQRHRSADTITFLPGQFKEADASGP